LIFLLNSKQNLFLTPIIFPKIKKKEINKSLEFFESLRNWEKNGERNLWRRRRTSTSRKIIIIIMCKN
jgi:hypothetical protein